MAAVVCSRAADRTAATWGVQLAPFTRLEFALSDGAKGIAAAVADRAEARREDPSAPALEHGLDIFHTAREAQRVLAPYWRRAEAAWEKAEAADAVVAEAKRQGIDARTRGLAGTARVEWGRARAALEQAERLQAAWDRARAALELFGPDGRLNDRGAASAAIAAALEELTGSDWSKLRRALEDRRSLAFLDRMHRRLEVAELRADWREAMAWRWWLLNRRVRCTDPLTRLIRAVGPVMRTCRSSAAQYNTSAARGLASSSVPLRLR